MTTDVVFIPIRDHLEANWTTSPLVFENERHTPAQPPAPWVYVDMASNLWDQSSMGSGDPAKERWEETGTIWLNVMVPAGTGSLTARTHARQLVRLFRGLTLLGGTLIFRRASIGDGQGVVIEKGKYWQITATIEFVNRA